MTLKKAKEFLKAEVIGHDKKCLCSACQAWKELRYIDKHRPEKHTIKDGHDREEFVETHESFGMLQISRQTVMQGVGGNLNAPRGANLFGSDILHSNLISLRVARGERHRSLHHDMNMARSEGLIEVVMSEVQFAQAITSMNLGSGVPCTINRFLGEGMENCPERTKMQEVHAEFKEDMKKIGAKITRLKESVVNVLDAKGPLKAGEKRELANLMASLLQDIESNMPFMAEQFSETVEHIMVQAKGEIEAHITGVVQRAGLKAMAEKGLEGEVPPMVALPSGKEQQRES